MTNPSVLVVLTCAALAVASSARAQDDGRQEQSRSGIEITPYVSLGSAAASGVGTAVVLPLGSRLSLELETALRRAEMNALNCNVSVLVDLPSVGRAIPYVVGGIGLEQYATAIGSLGGGLVVQARTAFTLNAGGGLRIPVDEHWGVRADARWFNGVGRDAPERWRVYNGVTFGVPGRR